MPPLWLSITFWSSVAFPTVTTVAPLLSTSSGISTSGTSSLSLSFSFLDVSSFSFFSVLSSFKEGVSSVSSFGVSSGVTVSSSFFVSSVSSFGGTLVSSCTVPVSGISFPVSFAAGSFPASSLLSAGSVIFSRFSVPSGFSSGFSASGFSSDCLVSSRSVSMTVSVCCSPSAYATAASGRMLPATVVTHKVPANNLTTAFRFMDSSLLSLWVLFVLLYQNGSGLRNILFISAGSFIMLCDLCLYQSFLVI